MPEETPLQLETYFLAFIEEMVTSGRFSSPSQVIQAGLRLFENTESRESAAALQKGEDSGWIEDFDFDEFLARKNVESDAAEHRGSVARQRGLSMPNEGALELDTYFLTFIDEMVASGRFDSPSQVVQAGLRLLEERESHGKALRAAIQKGLDSGWIEDFNLDEFLAEMRKEAEAKKVSDAA